MDKAELLKQLRTAHEKQLWDEEAVSRVLDEYAEQESREAFKTGYAAGIVHDENNPNVHEQEKRAWNIFNQQEEEKP